MQFFALFLHFRLQSRYFGNIKLVTIANIMACWVHKYQRLLQPSLLSLFIVSAYQLLMQKIVTSFYVSWRRKVGGMRKHSFTHLYPKQCKRRVVLIIPRPLYRVKSWMKGCVGLREGINFFQIRWSQILGFPSGHMVTTETTLIYHFTAMNKDVKLHRRDFITRPTVTVVMVYIGILGDQWFNSRPDLIWFRVIFLLLLT